MDSWALDENPVFMRCVRTQVRRGGTVPALVLAAIACTVILVVGALIARAAAPAPGPGEEAVKRGTSHVVLGVAGIALLGFGTARVSKMVSADRSGGNLEALRLTPTRAGVYLLGYLYGAPLREYLLAAAVVPFLLWSMLVGGLPFLDACVMGWLLIATAAIFHLGAILSALGGTGPRGRATGAGAGVAMLIGFWMLMSFVVNLARTARSMPGGPGAADAGIRFFGLPLSPYAYALVVEAFCAAFMAAAAVRKLAREGAPAFSKRQSLVFYAALHGMLLGTFWDGIVGGPRGGSWFSGGGAAVFAGAATGLIVVQALAGLWLATVLAPQPFAYRREWRRALATGTEPRRGSDGESGLRWLLRLVAVAAGGYGLLAVIAAWRGADLGSRALAAAVPPLLATTTLVYVGALYEWCVLRLRRGAMTWAAVVVAVLWIVPLVAAGILAGVDAEGPAALAGSISPIVSLGAAFVWIAQGPIAYLAADEHARTAALAGLAVNAVLTAVAVTMLVRLHARLREGFRTG